MEVTKDGCCPRRRDGSQMGPFPLSVPCADRGADMYLTLMDARYLRLLRRPVIYFELGERLKWRPGQTRQNEMMVLRSKAAFLPKVVSRQARKSAIWRFHRLCPCPCSAFI